MVVSNPGNLVTMFPPNSCPSLNRFSSLSFHLWQSHRQLPFNATSFTTHIRRSKYTFSRAVELAFLFKSQLICPVFIAEFGACFAKGRIRGVKCSIDTCVGSHPRSEEETPVKVQQLNLPAIVLHKISSLAIHQALEISDKGEFLIQRPTQCGCRSVGTFIIISISLYVPTAASPLNFILSTDQIHWPTL